MTKILHINASPRGTSSKSLALADAFLATQTGTIDRLDLWAENLPAFDGDKAAAKMTFFGDGEMDAPRQSAWDEITAITNRFTAADHYVLNVPMWNGGIPYRLKQYIDIITQPGLLFGFAPDTGYSGLLEGKRATVILTSGVWSPHAPGHYGLDFHSNYLKWWLNLVGVTDVHEIRFQPSLLTEDPAKDFGAVLDQLKAA